MELTIGNIIKIILGLIVVVAVSYGVYYFFSNNVFDFFKNFGVDPAGKFFIPLVN